MRQHIPLPRSGLLKQLILYDVPENSKLELNTHMIDLQQGKNIVDFEKMFCDFENRSDHLTSAESSLYYLLCLAVEGRGNTLHGLYFGSLYLYAFLWTDIKHHHEWSFSFQGNHISSGKSDIVFPAEKIDTLIITNSPKGELFSEKFGYKELQSGQNVIDFKDILHFIRDKEMKSRPGRAEIYDSEMSILHDSDVFSNFIHKLEDWTNPAWEYIQRPGKRLRIVQTIENDRNCDWIM